MNVQFLQAVDRDGAELAELRVSAMRESLEAVGRFDAARARDRFLKNFDPLATWKIYKLERLVGFYVLLHKRDHLYLDHLYIVNAEQGCGIGGKVLGHVKSLAQGKVLPIRLCALIGSDANSFYVKNGFVETGREEFDVHYEYFTILSGAMLDYQISESH